MPEQTASDRIVVVSQDAHCFASGRHTHEQAQLIYAISGVVSVTTTDGTWVVPPSRAVWVPAGIGHETKSHATVQFRALLIDPADVKGLPGVCAVVEVRPLLRELILRLAALAERPGSADLGRVVTLLLLLELSFPPVEPLNLPTPQHAQLARLCEWIQSDPVRAVSLEEAASALHMSRSSFMRLFKRETGMSFAHWRQQARLLGALSLLADGQSILNVALACGYDSPSAFSAMFRRSLGRSPSEYFARPAGDQGSDPVLVRRR
ncbi:AraC family transcriptional regulator [Phyllobacterium phragmitis]|uniref:AraC family transcriptional regulator n=1 Tax=Phyllobacterium phragmitis TaxID=2670329 RepID=A0A2S9IXU6_9HYPH|nr:helix-turn-helix transcriptional regulator [Phyllobacterium phragmitis]PRD45356.1 AraC family transcriptional regulator [Phyllobacterium phragmitis]